ncbi:hypothetical protein [uncultured Brachyspira sp.]|uniref:hypothetical protein n=1 Tax=uncultured Brachyspira sp. TaxID=221953 RepID=UPI002636C180|nr:hypothetical protein [uncultured Brachyspira sp.]
MEILKNFLKLMLFLIIGMGIALAFLYVGHVYENTILILVGILFIILTSSISALIDIEED